MGLSKSSLGSYNGQAPGLGGRSPWLGSEIDPEWGLASVSPDCPRMARTFKSPDMRDSGDGRSCVGSTGSASSGHVLFLAELPRGKSCERFLLLYRTLFLGPCPYQWERDNRTFWELFWGPRRERIKHGACVHTRIARPFRSKGDCYGA